MNKLVITLLFSIFATGTFANMIGEIENSKAHIHLDILDYMRRNVVHMNATIYEGSGKDSHRSIDLMIPVTTYNTIFNTDQTINQSIVGSNLEINAYTTESTRYITIVTTELDDSNDVAMRQELDLVLDGNTATMNITHWGRKTISWLYRSKLKITAQNGVSNLDIIKNGVGLFSDNRG